MTRPTPEAIAAAIHDAAKARDAHVTDPRECARIQRYLWDIARQHAITDATIRALATSEANACPFGPGTLDVLLAAESADASAVCDAVDSLAGEGVYAAGVSERGDIVMSRATLAALVRALCGGHRGA